MKCKLVFLSLLSLISLDCYAGPTPLPPIYLDQLKVPPGFKINLFARIPFIRQLNVAEDGMIYTGSSHHQGNNAVYAMVLICKYMPAGFEIPLVLIGNLIQTFYGLLIMGKII